MRIYLFAIFVLLSACGQKSNYIFHSDPPPQRFFAETYKIQEIDSSNRVDILWVIDDSGSMDSIQQNVAQNAQIFMQEFLKSNYIDWKMGIITTDVDYTPVLGFSTPFDRSTPDPVPLFSDTVRRLGTGGSSSEYVFYNTERAFKYPTHFLRPNSHLAVIMVTDEVEQSQEYGPSYKAAPFFQLVRNLIPDRYKVRFYGALNANGLDDCFDYAMAYTGTPYEEIIKLGEGFVISACKKDFGADLAKIGKDIASILSYPRLLLSARPKVETIKVTYKGVELEPGLPEQGGYWYYDDEFNLIIFYNLNFSQDFEFDSVDITFDINDGIIRP